MPTSNEIILETEKITGSELKRMISESCRYLEEYREELNALNVFPVPDGDTGINMYLTVKSATEEVIRCDEDDLCNVAKAISKGALMGARGNSGVILSQILRGMAKTMDEKEYLDAEGFATALGDGANVAYRSVMKPIEGTILTIIKAAAHAAQEFAASDKKDIKEQLKYVIQECEIILKKTPDMLPMLKEAGVVDAGGKGFLYILKGFLSGIANSEDVLIKENYDLVNSRQELGLKYMEDIHYSYCTELLLYSDHDYVDKIKEMIVSQGDSLVVVYDENIGIIKIHIHTNCPEYVLTAAMQFGQIDGVKIENMKKQQDKKNGKKVEDNTIFENKNISTNTAVIAIANGEGMNEIFNSIGTAAVINGGQTMNPSTQDILVVVENIDAKEIIILPNNKNIIMAANQVNDFTEKNVVVLPTTNIPEGICGMLAFSSEENIDTNINKMKEAMDRISVGEVTFAVRDSNIEGIMIKKDGIVGLIDDKIVVTGDVINEVAMKTLKEITTNDNEMITVYCGKEVEKGMCEDLIEEIKQLYENCEVDMQYGGQPLYYYILSVEK